MLFDARQVPPDTEVACDICIMGAGAAGITIARELLDKPFKVCLLESGGVDFEEEIQQLAAGHNVGHRYPDPTASRLRMLGGSTNHWEGNCSPLDAIDFERRPWVEHSGWPFGRDTLDPYYEQAQRYCQLGPFRYDGEHWSRLTKVPLLPLEGSGLETRVAQFSPPTRFGQRYRGDLERGKNINVVVHATVLEIQSDEQGGRVTGLRVGTLHGPTFRVTARYYVLAMGGIENARMLLLSNSVMPAGLANQNDLVGRYFMDHPVIDGAVFYPTRPFDGRLYQWVKMYDYQVTGYLQFSEAVLRRERLSNLRMPLMPASRLLLSDGVESFHQMGKALSHFHVPDHLWRHVGNMVSDIDMVIEAVSRKTLHRPLFGSADQFGGFMVDTMIEQFPNPDSRISLAEDRDAFGLRRVKIDWRLSAADKTNVERCYEVLAAEIGQAQIGRIRIDSDDTGRLWDDLLNYGHHHMGTTRAADDPRHGVVDGDLKAHGLSNLYIAGSSVFPTGGHVPPTLTIVALAIRLAGHLATQAIAPT